MSIRLSLTALALLLAVALGITGCGSSAAPGKPTVSLSILAPTSGATIGVRNITVAGTVTPVSAAVMVGGQPVKVVDGSYDVPLQMTQSSETITVTGQANGYVPASTSTTVQYSAQLAAAISASESTLGATHKTSSKSAHHKASGRRSTHHAKSSASKSSTSTSASQPHSTSSTPSSTSPQTPASPKSSPQPTSPKPTSPKPTPAKHTSSGRKVERKPVLTTKDIKRLWIRDCVKVGAGQTYASYCRCTYHHLERAGALRSRKRLDSLMKKLKPYERTHNIAKLPAFVRRAIIDCAAKLPGLDPLLGKPVLRKLPGLTHPRAGQPAPTGAAGTTPGGATPTAGSPGDTGGTPTGTGTSPAPTTGGTPSGTTGGTPSGTASQAAGGAEPPWASIVRELDHVVAAVAAHHLSASAPNDHRSVQKSHRTAASSHRTAAKSLRTAAKSHRTGARSYRTAARSHRSAARSHRSAAGSHRSTAKAPRSAQRRHKHSF